MRGNGQFLNATALPPNTHCIGGWVGPRAGLDIVEKRKFLGPAETRTPDCPSRSLVTILTKLSWLLVYTLIRETNIEHLECIFSTHHATFLQFLGTRVPD